MVLLLTVFSAGMLFAPGRVYTQDLSKDPQLAAAPPFHEMFLHSLLVMLLIDPATGRIVNANPAALEFYGYSHSRFTEMTIQEINRLTPAQVEEEFTRAAREERNFFIFQHRVADGSILTVEVTSQPYRFGEQSLLLSVIRDATSYRFLEADLWYYQSLLENQVEQQVSSIRRLQWARAIMAGVFVLILIAIIIYLLRTIQRLRTTEGELSHSNLILREVHHRIKNNMSSVMGLLTLQATKVGNLNARTALEDIRNHVEGMMQLYDTIYQADVFGQVPMDMYMKELVRRLVSHFPEIEKICVTTTVDPVSLDAKVVAPLGIIVTELVTNAMKYAFTGREDGQLMVFLAHCDGRVTLNIEDDGPGIPMTDSGAVEGFGLGLVRELATSQLRGSMSIESPGAKEFRSTRVVVEFMV